MIRVLFAEYFLAIGFTFAAVNVIIPEATENKNTTLECVMDHPAPSTLIWYKNSVDASNVLLRTNPNDVSCGGDIAAEWITRACGHWDNGTSLSHVVNLENVTLRDEITYICEIGPPPIEANANMLVTVEPTGTNLSVTTDTVLAVCNVPRVKPLDYMRFKWLVNGVEQSNYTNTSSQNSDGSYSATSTLNYPSCQSGVTTAKCQVEWKLKVFDSQEENLPTPPTTNLTSNTNEVVSIDTEVTLYCEVTVQGYPSNYSYTWTRHSGQQLPCTQSTCTFNVENVSDNDTYSCVASNGYCEGNTATFRLTVIHRENTGLETWAIVTISVVVPVGIISFVGIIGLLYKKNKKNKSQTTTIKIDKSDNIHLQTSK